MNRQRFIAMMIGLPVIVQCLIENKDDVVYMDDKSINIRVYTYDSNLRLPPCVIRRLK